MRSSGAGGAEAPRWRSVSDDQRRPFAGRAGPRGIHVLVEQFGELLHHGAAEFLGIDDGYRTAVVARHVVADADGDEFDLVAVLDVADHLAQMLFQVVAWIHRQ